MTRLSALGVCRLCLLACDCLRSEMMLVDLSDMGEFISAVQNRFAACFWVESDHYLLPAVLLNSIWVCGAAPS